jgi:hypothetical protein
MMPSLLELAIVLFLIGLPLFAGILVYRTGKDAGDKDALRWAIIIGLLTLFFFPIGIIAVAVYSYKTTEI